MNPAYSISDHGNVQRLKNGEWKPVKLSNTNGYRMFNIKVDGKQSIKSVHRMVLRTFKGDPPDESYHCCHWDGTRDNNHLSNLRWATAKENSADMVRHGTDGMGHRPPLSTTESSQVFGIRLLKSTCLALKKVPREAIRKHLEAFVKTNQRGKA